jgi:hypothetical protein
MARGSFFEKTPRSRSSALLVWVTRCDQRFPFFVTAIVAFSTLDPARQSFQPSKAKPSEAERIHLIVRAALRGRPPQHLTD